MSARDSLMTAFTMLRKNNQVELSRWAFGGASRIGEVPDLTARGEQICSFF